MLTRTQQTRLAKECASVLTSAVESLPDLLKRSEPEAAAQIVAGLLKAVLTQPLPEPDPAAELKKIIRRTYREAEREEPPADRSTFTF